MEKALEIVRVDRVEELKTDAHGDYSAVMRDGTVVPVSRSYKSAFLERFRRDT